MFHLILVVIYAVFVGIVLVVHRLQIRRLSKNDLTPQEYERLNRLTYEKTLADYRVRFRTAPLGVWAAAVGTASIVMDEVWEFLPDGAGICSEYGPFGMDKGITQFEWEPAGDFTLLCHVTKNSWEDYPGQDAEEEENSSSPSWQTVVYDFHVTETDCGRQIAMVSVSEGIMQERFWFSEFALGYSGPIKSIEQVEP